MFKDIDEAIAYAREVAEEQRVKNRTCGNCKYCKKGQIHPRQGYCYFNAIHYEHDLTQKACSDWESNDDIGLQCAEEHKQLAEWLEELKFLRTGLWLAEHNKQIKVDAIDEVKDIIANYHAHIDDDAMADIFSDLEQLKE